MPRGGGGAARCETPVESPRIAFATGADGLSVGGPRRFGTRTHEQPLGAICAMRKRKREAVPRGVAAASDLEHERSEMRSWCELQNPANHLVFERKLHPRPLGQGYTCLGVTPGVFSPLPMPYCPTAGGAAHRRGRADWSSLPPAARLAEKFAKLAIFAESTSLENGWRLCARPIPRRQGNNQAPMGRRAWQLPRNLGREPGRSGRGCRSWWNLPTLETAQPEVGSSGRKSTTRRVVSGAPPATHENPRTVCRPCLVVLITTSGLQGKGSRQNGSVTLGKGLALRAGHGGPSPEPSVVGGLLELLPWQERVVACRPGDGLGTAPLGAVPGRRTTDSELVRIHQVLDCSPTNREHDLGLDRREIARPMPPSPPACRPMLGAFQLPRARVVGDALAADEPTGAALKHNSRPAAI
ncbi:hypothetical protein H6P81_015919 [Aristolochia fimbriata]|uniref:Uncharacterized protein n=1 Tax=Aristolochia fimbriata TaxID=158543 RepID=A0AAV7E8L7_ARIFI|nr:hypothetical protein H6P81_015919 [Aristolochia fimbriata]